MLNYRFKGSFYYFGIVNYETDCRMLLIYRLFFPLVFLFFLPGLIWKLIRRPGWKKTYMERFGIFSAERKNLLREWRGAIWLHAVSVGETNLALTLLNEWNKVSPNRRFILSTTTTTGQEIARNKAPDNVKVIFCPIDSGFFVRRTLNLIMPSALVIFETELWPNLIMMSKKRGIKLALVNTRISDKSFGGYRRFRFFFAPLLKAFNMIMPQTALDAERISVIAPGTKSALHVTGNIKFDQEPPSKAAFELDSIFGKDDGKRLVITGASTHEPEDALIIDSFVNVKRDFPSARLIIVPRHAERGNDIEKLIADTGIPYLRRSNNSSSGAVPEILLADTTGELASFIKSSDIVIMGKTLCGNDEGQNIIEPAIMGKAIISGRKLKNFRQALDALVKAQGVVRIADDSMLAETVKELLSSPEKREELGSNAQKAILANRGALSKTIEILNKEL